MRHLLCQYPVNEIFQIAASDDFPAFPGSLRFPGKEWLYRGRQVAGKAVFYNSNVMETVILGIKIYITKPYVQKCNIAAENQRRPQLAILFSHCIQH